MVTNDQTRWAKYWQGETWPTPQKTVFEIQTRDIHTPLTPTPLEGQLEQLLLRVALLRLVLDKYMYLLY